MVTILYALISIPCTSATLIYCGRLIVGIIKLIVVTFEGKLLKRKRIHYFQRKFIGLQLLATVGSVMLFAYYHNSIVAPSQSFSTSLYFVFITVSTIGFGDIVPGQSHYASSTLLEVAMTALLEFNMIFTSMALVAAMISALTNIASEESGGRENQYTAKVAAKHMSAKT